MKREYIVKCLNRLKEIQATNSLLAKAGVDVTEYADSIVHLLEEGICLLVSGDDKTFEENLDLVQWWLYDQPNKIFYYDDKPDLDVNKPEDFAEYLLKGIA